MPAPEKIHLAAPPSSLAEQEPLAREIAATDREIDALVYALYDLTPEEIAIIEGA